MSASSTAPQFTFPPETFEAGKSYTMRAITVSGGYPRLADGDLTVRTLPVAVGYMDCAVFTISP